MAKQWWEEAPLAQEQRGEWWEAAPLAQAPEQPKQDEWWKAAPKVEAEEKQSVFRQVADVPLKVGSGLVQGVRMVADAFGAGSGVSETLKGAEDYVAALYSAQSKKDSQEVARIMKDAEDKGVGDQVKAAVKAFAVAPVDLVSNALGTAAPVVLAGLATALGGAPALVTRGVGLGIGALMGAGTVKGSIYDAVKEELEKTDMPKSQIEARAQLAQDYDGKNLDMILTGAALGGLGSVSGVEPALARQLSKGILSRTAQEEAVTVAAKEAAELAAKRGVIKQGAITGLKESATEFPQGAQEQLAQNLALQREGYDVPTMRGVVGQGTLEGLAGLGLGVVTGGREASAAKKEIAKDAVSQDLQDQGVDKVAADKAADNVVKIEEQKTPIAESTAPTVEEAAAAPAPGVPQIDPARVEQLTTTFTDMGLTPAEANIKAVETATLEAEDDAAYERTAQGAEDVAGTDTTAGGAGAPVVGQPGAVSAPAGVGAVEPSGVVPAGQNVTGTPAGEAIQQPALTEAPVAEAPVAEAPVAEAPVAEAPVAEAVEGIPPVEEQAALQEELAAEQAKTDVDHAEEAPIPDSVANVVGDLADLAPEIEAETQVEAAPKGKRGPKGARLTPEQKAASDQRREQQRKDWKSNSKTVDAADTALNDALTPLDPSGYDSLEAAQEAVESKRISKIQAIKSLMLLGRVLKGTQLGARVETLLKNPAITARELADIKTGIAAQVSKSAAQVKTGRADTRFNGMTTGQQALRHVIKTGNAFQKFLAQRLLPFVKDVRFQVVEENDPLPAQITEGGAVEDWDASRGLFLRVVSTGERFVFVRGATGGPSQGINNVTVLHEMLHAALNKKMDMADWALRSGYDRASDLATAFKSLQETIRLTQERMADMQEAGTLPESMYQLVDSGIFTDAREFVAYAMSDPAFQKFLMDTPGVLKQSLFTRFVNNVRQFFNMGPTHTSALFDVISTTDKMLSSRMTPLMRAEVKNEQLTAKEAEVSSALKTKKKRVNATEVKLEKSNAADTFRDLGTLTNLRSVDDFLNVMVLRFNTFKNEALRQLLPTLQTSAVVQWADRLGVKGIKESWQYLGDMAAMRNERTNALMPISDKLAKLHRKAFKQFKALADVMHYSTLLSRDPTKPFYLLAGTGKDRISMSFATAAERDAYTKANAQKLQDLGGGREFTDSTLERLWKGLTPDVQKLYSEVRDFYIDNHNTYQSLLQEQINASKLDPTAQKKVIAELKKMYEDGKKLYPYFPLMRYGQYWLRVGKGKNREFYMFESQYDRDAFAQSRAKQLGGVLDDLVERGEVDIGNNLSDARKRDLEPSGMLKKMFEAIEAGAIGKMVDDGFGNLVSTGMAEVDVESLKDEIYQMYLQTLPDRNFRRQFMHRQGTTGFTGDIARNFAVTGTNMANQLARIKYGPKIMGQIDRANDSLKGNPDKVKLGEFVAEMRMRAEEQVRPNPENGFGFAISNLLNQSAYLFLMTSVKTATAQLTAIPIFVGPVLTSNHGFNPAKVAISLTKSLAIFGSTGVTRTAADGTSTYEFPSMLNNQLVKLTGDEQLAAQYMVDRGLSDTTLAYDLGNRRAEPTQATQGATRRVLRVTSNTMTALFHHTERMVREVTFMTSYRLYRSEINPDTKKKYTHEEALPLAEAETYQALGNYHASERPRGLVATAERGVVLNAHKPLGRSLLQFKMFPAFVTTFFIRNAYRMVAGLDAKDRAKAMTQFFGTLAMSGALAGYVGIPGASLVMGVIQGMMNAIRWAKDDEDDEEDPLGERDLEFWFRNKWLPDTFGSVKVGDHTLDEVLDRGLLATMTGYDISGSLSLNNMWFPEVKESATASAAVQEYLMSLLGPGASLTLKQVPKAIDYFYKGEIERGFEQLSPAFIRGEFTARRYEREGATTSSGAIIKDADEFTKGQLWAQRFGFATEGLVAQREAIFHLQGEILKVKRERTAILDRLEREIDKGSDEDVDSAMTKLFKFNANNPYDAIKYENIKASLKKQLERKIKSDRGMPIDKKYYPQVMEFLEPATRKLDREAEAARK
jgi:hypothetical protein